MSARELRVGDAVMLPVRYVVTSVGGWPVNLISIVGQNGDCLTVRPDQVQLVPARKSQGVGNDSGSAS